ncbi:contact-dependent growth inhibition system immunity protein [Serratia sp. NA_13]|uniref:contact-dependent growth inhibition system immunity protein n=1 Tax=Serratia sp. NA_13 TaxID=3415658 RepID=UPI004046E52E
MNTNFIHLGVLVRVFFGQGYDLFGGTVDEIFTAYKNTENPQTVQKTINEANDLLKLFSDEKELESVFAELTDGEFSPAAWGLTPQSFLKKVVDVLST